MAVGTVRALSGFITQAKYLRSKTTLEVERRLGYRSGRLAQGYTLWFLLDPLRPEDFEFRGYTQMSGGVPMGHKPSHANDPNAEESLRAGGYDVDAIKRRICEETFKYSGPDRLCKVTPNAPVFGENDYPPGSGIPQWEILRHRAKRFKVAAEIAGDGRYTGDYH
ncbi:MAG: hypothetical protein AAF127_02850 [Pseudomonadota bacterium]